MKKPQTGRDLKPAAIPVAVIGMGLMGSSIAACLLASGHRVTGVTRSAGRARTARQRIREFLVEMRREGLLRGTVAAAIQRLTVTRRYADLAGVALVVESSIEDEATKHRIFRKLEKVIPPAALIGSNTSAIPITRLQAGARHPERIYGLHWAEPAHITRFLEIICGGRSAPAGAEWLQKLSAKWGKDPGLVRRDIRGFIANRCMYAMFREAFHLVESGVCTIEDVDRSVSNDMGWWLTFAGPFRFMDLTGLSLYYSVMRDLSPELNNAKTAPRMLAALAKAGARGTTNGHGFYPYTKASARAWDKAFEKFSYDVRRLAGKHRKVRM